MRTVVFALLFLGAHFAGTAFVPGPKANIIWPFGVESRSVRAGIGGLPTQGGSVVTPLLAGITAIAFAGAFLAMLGLVVPAEWFVALVVSGSLASIALFVLFAGMWAILPVAVDLLLLWGVLAQGWTVAMLRAG